MADNDLSARQAYRMWIATALAAVKTPPAAATQFAATIRTYLKARPHLWSVDDDDVQKARWRDGLDAEGKRISPHAFGTDVRGWREGKVPQPNALREALACVVTNLAPEPPAGLAELGDWPTFADVLSAVVAVSDSNRRRHAAEVKQSTAEKRFHAARDNLRAQGRSGDIDPLMALGLGSWAFGDELPPYVSRDADQMLAKWITDPQKRIAVVVGPPKAGKSRSVYEVLRAVASEAQCWWHNPSRDGDSIASIVDRINAFKDGEGKPDVIVFEDAGFNDVGPSGLTSGRLTRIFDCVSTVIVIIHEADLAAWRDHAIGGQAAAQLTDFADAAAIGASPELVQMLDTHAVEYSATLTGAEIERAQSVYHRWLAEGDDPLGPARYVGANLNRLPEALAAVDKLESKARKGLAAGGIRAALVEAVIDASFIDPIGVDAELLRDLTAAHYRRIAPHGRWRGAHFDSEFDWATTGFSAGSPHAIIVRGGGGAGGDVYRLFDALSPRLVHPDRDLDHLAAGSLRLTADHHYSIGWALYQARRREEAARWWLLAADAGHRVAMLNVGVLVHLLGRPIGGRDKLSWWLAAAQAGDSGAMNNLGVHAKQSGEIVGGHDYLEWWRMAADAGDSQSMATLGNCAALTGQPIGGRDELQWWLLAARGGHSQAMYYLAWRAKRLGGAIGGHDHIGWLRLSAEAGHRMAMAYLGVLAHRLGEPVGGYDRVGWWHRAAAAGEGRAMQLLGLIAEEERQAVLGRSAVQWFQLAAEAGFAGAMLDLGNLAHRSGAPIGGREGVQWWLDAAAAGNPGAAYSLGYIAYERGDPINGLDHLQWWMRAAAGGNIDAMYALGVTARKMRDSVGGRDHLQWWLHAANGGHHSAMYMLGVEARDSGELIGGRSSLEWWLPAAAAGSVPAMVKVADASEHSGASLGGRTADQWRALAAERKQAGPRP